jgi:AcrR family transcriptional regulator
VPHRTYDSSSRRQAAQRRRGHVIDVAAELFAEHGFEATTLTHIATAAGVSVPYLQKLGSKGDLVEEAIAAATTGPALRTEQDYRAWRAHLVEMPTSAGFIEAVTRWTVDANARSFGLWSAWGESPDPELRASWLAQMQRIRSDWRSLLDELSDHGWWRTDIDRTEQVATVWLLTMAATYQRMVVVAGLSPDQYADWLRRSLTEVLVGPIDEPTRERLSPSPSR